MPAILLPAEVPKYGLPDFTFSAKTVIKFSSCKVFTRRKVFPPPVKKPFASFTAAILSSNSCNPFTLILICSKKSLAICVYSSCEIPLGLAKGIKIISSIPLNNSAISSLIYSKYFPPKSEEVEANKTFMEL